MTYSTMEILVETEDRCWRYQKVPPQGSRDREIECHVTPRQGYVTPEDYTRDSLVPKPGSQASHHLRSDMKEYGSM